MPLRKRVIRQRPLKPKVKPKRKFRAPNMPTPGLPKPKKTTYKGPIYTGKKKPPPLVHAPTTGKPKPKPVPSTPKKPPYSGPGPTAGKPRAKPPASRRTGRGGVLPKKTSPTGRIGGPPSGTPSPPGTKVPKSSWWAGRKVSKPTGPGKPVRRRVKPGGPAKRKARPIRRRAR